MATPYNVAKYLQVFDDRLKRIVEECYEVAFIICNSDMEEFTTAKIFDVFNQTLPTAYVLNTGYWPFYSTIKGQSLCVCGRFGIACRHVKSDFHWIDISSIDNDPSAIVFQPKVHGPLFPEEYQIDIKSILADGVHGCHISAHMNVHYKNREKGRLRRERTPKSAKDQQAASTQKDIYSKIFNITLIAEFYIRAEFYQAMFTIIFQPSPFFHEQYGTYFKNLNQLRAEEFVDYCGDQQRIWCISCPQMPVTTFLLRQVNVAIYKLPAQVLVYYPYYMKAKGLKTKRNKSSQTTDDYTYRIGQQSSNIWNYYADHSQTISGSVVNMASTVVTQSNYNTQEPFVIEDSESFDNQWPVVGHSRVIQPNFTRAIVSESTNRTSTIHSIGRASHATSRVSDNTANLTASTSTANFPFEPDSTTTTRRPSLPVSLPVQSTASDFPCLLSTTPQPVTSKMDFSKALRNPPPYSGKKMSSMEMSPKVLVKTEMDEEFELIETVIWEDVMKKEEDWWDVGPNSSHHTTLE